MSCPVAALGYCDPKLESTSQPIYTFDPYTFTNSHPDPYPESTFRAIPLFHSFLRGRNSFEFFLGFIRIPYERPRSDPYPFLKSHPRKHLSEYGLAHRLEFSSGIDASSQDWNLRHFDCDWVDGSCSFGFVPLLRL